MVESFHSILRPMMAPLAPLANSRLLILCYGGTGRLCKVLLITIGFQWSCIL